MRELPPALSAMGAYQQFIVYIAVPSKTKPGKTDKFPCDFRTGEIKNAHDAQYWTDHKTAIAAAANFGDPYGVGFVFTERDPFWFLDIDHCVTDGAWSPTATAFFAAFEGAAIEVSRSGNGAHIFGTGRPPEHSCRNEPYGLEFYHTGRFVALTGINAIGDASKDFSASMAPMVAQFFPPIQFNSAYTEGMPTGKLMDVWREMCLRGPSADWRGPTDDNELIRRAMMSRSPNAAFDPNKASFADLFKCKVEVLARAWPDPERAYGESNADAALAQHLAFWTGRDCARIERLMRESELVRDKWTREDYIPRTILGAVSRQFEVLTDKAPEPVPGAPDAPFPTAAEVPLSPKLVTGSTFASIEDQQHMFTGCVYIREAHKVLIPGGALLKPEQFKVHFGGYSFTMDPGNERSVRDAWEAFTQSQAIRTDRADNICFRPDKPPGAIIPEGGLRLANTYWPVDVPRKVGDPSRFLNHLRKLLPDERDNLILLSYMAACVQHKGVKFQWAPLIQGVEGNGKSMFTRCVAEAVGRRYVHWPKASQLDGSFNGWLMEKIFFGVEDIYIAGDRAELWETLKPMITGGDGLEIQRKGVDQFSANICGNFMLNSNHQNAVPKTDKDRRLCIFFTAQQLKSHLDRDGMSGDYFPQLYDWLRADGYAIVSELLHTFPIPDEFNPGTKCHRAPETTTTHAAIHASSGSIEQEIQECIEQSQPGFCGGYISSMAVDRLLERLRKQSQISHSKRKDLLEGMGYHMHPALKGGRVNNDVMPDAGKPRLFVLKDSAAWQLATASDVAQDYQRTNNHGRVPFPA